MQSTELNNMHRRTLVISGVNMTEGGILSVLRNVVEAAERVLPTDWRILVLAHRRSLLDVHRAEVYEFPKIKSSWLRRMKFELFTSRRIAREVSADVWLALHDITPLVDVERQYVYCHNPTCFTRPTLKSLYFDWIFVAHSLLYGMLYSLNIRRNTEVFVQQAWIRDVFIQRFGARSVVVSRPRPFAAASEHFATALPSGHVLRRWVYPTFARHFKNVEVIGEALEILERGGGWEGEVQVTIRQGENRYADWLMRRFGHLKSLKLIGRQTAEQVQELYATSDGLLFPSTLETWGLPITEAQAHGLPLLVADLPYAHETVGSYHGVTFFDPHDAVALAALLRRFADGQAGMGGTYAEEDSNVFSISGWEELVHLVCAK